MNNQTQIHYCIYCHQEAKYQFKNGKWCCAPHMNGCPEIKRQRSEAAKQQWQNTHNQGKTHFDIKPVIIPVPNICAYCGKEASYQLKNGKWCCKPSSNQCPHNIAKNSMGVLKAYDNGLAERKKAALTDEIREKLGRPNRGKTKFNCQRLKLRGQQLHQRYLNGELTPSFKNRKHSAEEIDKIVKGMNAFRIGVQTKGIKYGWYKGYWCDSSWELAYVIYNIDHNIKFKRNHEGFPYYFNNKLRKYYPDFVLDDETFIEIKGYPQENVTAKINQFPQNKKLVVLYKKDLTEIFRYVHTKYGKDFWNLLKATSEESLQN